MNKKDQSDFDGVSQNQSFFAFIRESVFIFYSSGVLIYDKMEHRSYLLMTNKKQTTIDEILTHRYDNGFDYWTTPDKKLFKGAPFTILECHYIF